MAEKLNSLSFEDVFVGSRERGERCEIPQENTTKIRTDLDSFLKKTPLMLLEEGSKGVYQVSPVWEVQEIPGNSPEFEMVLTLKDITVRARGNSKKVAKQRAAVAYLREAVIRGRKDIFFIPGQSPEEAIANIELLTERSDASNKVPPNLKKEAVTLKDVDRKTLATSIPPEFADKNWVGKLQETAQKMENKENPTYEDSQLEGAERKFLVTCTIFNRKTSGLSNTKKSAKNIAAYLMYSQLVGGSSMNGINFDCDLGTLEEDEQISSARTQAFAEKNKKLALEKLLSDKERFSSYSMKVVYPSMSTLGKHQIMLEVQTERPISPEHDDLQIGAEHTHTPDLIRATARERKKLPEPSSKVFSGIGSTEEEAIERACQSALIHFNTFKE